MGGKVYGVEACGWKLKPRGSASGKWWGAVNIN